MSKGLEALVSLELNACETSEQKEWAYKIIEKELKGYERMLKVFGMEELANTERKLQALEIIKEKLVDMCLLENSCTRDEYNKWISQNDLGNCYLEQEEYDLLKEVLS